MFQWVSSYDFDFVVASIPVQIILIIFYCSRKNLPLRSSRSFLIAMIANLAMTVSDIFACEMIAVWTKYSASSLYIVNIIYFLTYVLRSWALFDYTAQEVGAFRNGRWHLSFLLALPAIAVSVAMITTPWTGAVFSITADSGYVSGPSYRMIYTLTYFYIGAALFCIILRWKTISARMICSLIGYNIVLTIGTVLRNQFMNVLVMPYFSILAILIIYLSAQNPDFYLDRNVRIFNQSAFDKIIRQYISENKSYGFITVKIDNYEAAKALYGNAQLLTSLVLIGRWMTMELYGFYAFYFGNGSYVLLHEGGLKGSGSSEGGSYGETTDRIINRFTYPWIAEDTETYLTISTMVLPPDILKDDDHDLHDVINYCFHIAHYENNRGNIMLEPAMLESMSRNADVESAIGRALEEHRMEFYLQPIIDSKTGNVIGAEALARLNDPVLGFIPPFEFISIAEKTGDIMEMGRQIFESVCSFLETTDIKKYGLINLNVNLSPIQCMNSQLESELSEIAERHDVALGLIDFEITETAIEESGMIKEQIERLQNKGAMISLDDFGMGTSNLARLMKYPIHVAKLDINIVRSYFSGELPVLPDLIRMFHNSGMKVVAEGIETEEMRDGLIDMGCDYLQGYYYSRPVTPEEFIRYLEQK